MLAQIGRPGLVRDLARRLVADFAGNLDRHMWGATPREAAPELSGWSIVSDILRARVARFFGRRGEPG
jgi:carbon-monoxide dehydrogenase small subunit